MKITYDSCYFCASIESIEEHHIVPRRYGGSDKDKNLVNLCQDCHKKIERLYNKDFYRRIGYEEMKTERGFMKVGMRRRELCGEKDTRSLKKKEGWSIAFSEDQFQPICPDCDNIAKIANIYISEDKDQFIFELKCDRCRIRGEKESIPNPALDPDKYRMDNLTRDLKCSNIEPEDNLKKNIPIERWHLLGNKLKEIDDLLNDIITENGIPTGVSDEFYNVVRKLDKARDQLEQRFFEEYPDEADIHTFFGSKKNEVNIGEN